MRIERGEKQTDEEFAKSLTFEFHYQVVWIEINDITHPWKYSNGKYFSSYGIQTIFMFCLALFFGFFVVCERIVCRERESGQKIKGLVEV